MATRTEIIQNVVASVKSQQAVAREMAKERISPEPSLETIIWINLTNSEWDSDAGKWVERGERYGISVADVVAAL